MKARNQPEIAPSTAATASDCSLYENAFLPTRAASSSSLTALRTRPHGERTREVEAQGKQPEGHPNHEEQRQVTELLAGEADRVEQVLLDPVGRGEPRIGEESVVFELEVDGLLVAPGQVARILRHVAHDSENAIVAIAK